MRGGPCGTWNGWAPGAPRTTVMGHVPDEGARTGGVAELEAPRCGCGGGGLGANRAVTWEARCADARFPEQGARQADPRTPAGRCHVSPGCGDCHGPSSVGAAWPFASVVAGTCFTWNKPRTGPVTAASGYPAGKLARRRPRRRCWLPPRGPEVAGPAWSGPEKGPDFRRGRGDANPDRVLEKAPVPNLPGTPWSSAEDLGLPGQRGGTGRPRPGEAGSPDESGEGRGGRGDIAR